MDTRRLVTVMLLAMAAILGWQLLMDAWFESQGWTVAPVEQEVATTQPTTDEASDASATAPATAAVATTQPAPVDSAPAAGLHVLPPDAPAAPVVLGSLQPRDETYALAMEVSPRAAVSSVTLNRFRQEIKSDEPYVFQTPYLADTRLPLQTLRVAINGQPVDLSNATWSLGSASNDAVTWHLTIADASQPVLRIEKLFQVRPREHEGEGYETLIQQTLVNLSQQPLDVQLTMYGPTTPPREIDRGVDRHVVGGYNDQVRVRLEHRTVEEFTADEPRQDLTTGPRGLPLLWVGTSGIYFNAIVRPNLAQGSAPLIASAEAEALNPSEDAANRQVALTLQSSEMTVAPGQQQVLPMEVFFGPKQRAVLKNGYYDSAMLGYDQTLVMVTGICGICTWQWLIDILVWMLRTFHFVLRDWGLAIIALVCVVRGLLHPITKRSQISMMRMSKMGPELERLKKKYGDNKDELNKAMWEFQKQQGIGPYLGCLPMFLQMPIWIALWQALQSTFELRHASFLHFNGLKLTWIYDLAKPDHLIEFERTYEFFFLQISGLNVLPILLGVVFFLQQKLMQLPATTPEQRQQQKMMMWMSLLFPLFLYGGPSGLNLYILTSTTIGIIESKIVRKHIREREEAEKEGKVIVDAGKRGPGGGHGKGGKLPEPKAAPKTGIAGWLARLQAKAEEMQREAQRKQRGKGKA